MEWNGMEWESVEGRVESGKREKKMIVIIRFASRARCSRVMYRVRYKTGLSGLRYKIHEKQLTPVLRYS